MIIRVLGTVSPYSKGEKNCPGFLVEYNDKKILLDCGNGVTRLLDFPNDLKNLKVFISHLHPDHCGDLTSLFNALYVYKKHGYVEDKIKVYLPDGDKESVKTYEEDFDDPDKINTIYEDQNSLNYRYFEQFEESCPIEIIPYSKLKENENNMTIETMKTLHGIDTYAFKITTNDGILTYSADTGFNKNIINFAKDSDLLICESTFLRGQSREKNTHLFAYEAGRIAREAKVKKLLITHFWPEIDKELYLKEAKEEFENVEVAEENKKLVLRRN